MKVIEKTEHPAVNIGNLYEAEDNFRVFLKSLRESPASIDSVLVVLDAVRSCILIAKAYEETNKPKKAIRLCWDFLNCLIRFQATSDFAAYPYAAALIHSSMARLYDQIGHCSSAAAYYREALDLYLAIWDTRVLDRYECNVLNTIISLADLYIDNYENDAAVEVLSEGVQLLTDLTERNRVYLDDCGIVYFKISDYYGDLRRDDEKWMYFNQAVEIYRKIIEDEQNSVFDEIRKDFKSIDEPVINDYYMVSRGSSLRKIKEWFCGKRGIEIYDLQSGDKHALRYLFQSYIVPAMISYEDRKSLEKLMEPDSWFWINEVGILTSGSTENGDPVYFCFTGQNGDDVGDLELFVLSEKPQRFTIETLYQNGEWFHGLAEWYPGDVLSYYDYYIVQGASARNFICIYEDSSWVNIRVKADYSNILGWESRTDQVSSSATVHVSGESCDVEAEGFYPAITPAEVKLKCDVLLEIGKRIIEVKKKKNVQITGNYKMIPWYNGGIVRATKIFIEPENRFAIIELIKGLFVAVKIESMDHGVLVGSYIDHITDSFDDEIMLYKHDADWSNIPFGFFKLTCWAPEKMNEHNGSSYFTVKRFYFDKELYRNKYEEINGVSK